MHFHFHLYFIEHSPKNPVPIGCMHNFDNTIFYPFNFLLVVPDKIVPFIKY